MSAHWPSSGSDTGRAPDGGTPLPRIRLGLLLQATARRHPHRLAFIDPADKSTWAGRPAISWSYAASAEIVERLATDIRAWRLAPHSRIGLCLPGSAEASLAFLAIESAGHLPVLLPTTWDENRLVAGAVSAGLTAIVTQSRFGSLALAERCCAVAARYYGLRYLAAFGPDVPDGVVNLDEMVLEPGRAAARTSMPEDISGSFITFADGNPEFPVERRGDSLIAAASAHLLAQRAAPAERILNLLAPHDLRGLVTGLASALVAGASLETMPVFDGAAFVAALRRPIPTHLVGPAFFERNLAGRALPSHLRAICIAHRAPTSLANSQPSGPDILRLNTVIDTLAFGEDAVVSGRRGSPGDVASVVARPELLKLPGNLLSMRCEADGRIAFRGLASAAGPARRGGSGPLHPETWRTTRFQAVLSSGNASAIVAR